jgi:hypothetical protein
MVHNHDGDLTNKAIAKVVALVNLEGLGLAAKHPIYVINVHCCAIQGFSFHTKLRLKRI